MKSDKLVPYVSVFVASYNNAKYIRESLDSVLTQTYPYIELIIVDDASIDNSVQVIEDWLAETKYSAKFIQNEKNLGICKSSNVFLSNATGAYTSWLASDDIMLPHKLATQVTLLEAAGPEVGVVYSDLSKIDPQGNITVPSIYATGQIRPSGGDVWLPLLRTNFIGAMTALVRRSSAETVGGYDEALSYEDWDMWLRLARDFEFIYQPEVTCHYRIHGNSFIYKRKRQLIESNLRIVSKHLAVSPEGDAIIHQHIADFAEELYLLGSPESTRWLAERYRLRPDRRGLALLWLARLGVPAAPVARAYGWLKSLTGTTVPTT